MPLPSPFEREAPGRYAALGAREPKALSPLPKIEGDGVVGSMSAHWRAWRRLGAPRKVVQWLRSGVPLVWAKPPQPTPPTARRVEESREMKEEMEGLISSGAFSYQDTDFVSPTFIIPKKDGGRRVIHDLRAINTALRPPKFTLHGAREAASVVRESNWLVALDLKHGYQQVAMDLKARHYLGAVHGGRTVVSNVLPFGLNISPYVFTRITSWLAREMRKRFHLNVAVYVDDFIIGASTKEELEEGLRRVKDLFGTLGVCLSEKTSHEPAQIVEFLGFTWNALTKEVSVTQEKRRQYRREVKNLLRHAQGRQCWMKLVGKLIFLREAVGPSLRHTRSLMRVLRGARNGRLLAAEGEARDDLIWWDQVLRTTPRMSLKVLPTSGVVTTDASDFNIGAVVEVFGEQAAEASKSGQKRATFSMPVEDKNAHINVKELDALFQVIERNKEQFRDKKIMWFTDNMTAKAAIARQGTQQLSHATWEKTKQILDLANREGIQIVPRWVPGRLNGCADSLSRPSEEKGEWETALAKVTGAWGPLQEDPFGFTEAPTSLFSSLEWTGRRTLLVPRVREIDNTLTLLGMVRAEETPQLPPAAWESLGVVITPLWRGALWWPKLEALRTGFIPLGRIHCKELARWEERNGHPSEWTASLVPTKARSWHPEQ